MRYTDLFEANDPSSVDSWRLAIIVKYQLVSFDVYVHGTYLELSRLIVNKEQQGLGIGSDVMVEFCQFADAHKFVSILSPAEKDDGIGTSSRSRLVKFYKEFGFVENKGRNKDFGTTAAMIRTPT